MVPHPGTTPNSHLGEAGGGLEEDGESLDGAGIDHGDEAALEVAVIGEGAVAVDGRVDDGSGAAQRALDVGGHVVSDGDDAGGIGDQSGGLRVGFQLAGPKGKNWGVWAR